MQLTSITIDNVLGIRAVRINSATPVTLVAGNNGAGKSSIAEAVRQALGLDPARVDLKKEFGHLLHGGAKAGVATVQFGEDQASIILPAGKLAIAPALDHPAMPYCIDPDRFAKADSKDRRGFLISLMGVKISGKVVAGKLAARGLNDEYCAQVVPMLAAGFDAAATEAQDKARDAKAAWRAVTGETYGDKKGDDWAAAVPESVSEAALIQAENDVDLIDGKLAEANSELGAVRERARNAVAQANARAEMEEKASKIDRIKAKLAVYEQELANWTAKVEETLSKAEGTKATVCHCPECRAALVWRNGELLPADIEKTANPEAVAKLPEYQQALAVVQRAVENDRRDLAASQAAAEQLATMTAPDAPSDLEAIETRVAALKADKTAKESALADLRTKAGAAATAKQKTADAAKHHGDVQYWAKIAEALSPDGIPAELLRDALAPFNATLQALSDLADWPKVEVSDDMDIAVGGRPYRFRSESEKWRADSIIAAAIAKHSGLNFIMLDRFDVLDGSGRSEAFYWLDDLAGEGFSALVMGTLRSIPAGLPASISGYWIENSTVGGMEVEGAHNAMNDVRGCKAVYFAIQDATKGAV